VTYSAPQPPIANQKCVNPGVRPPGGATISTTGSRDDLVAGLPGREIVQVDGVAADEHLEPEPVDP
jgi:hypothetical protein